MKKCLNIAVLFIAEFFFLQASYGASSTDITPPTANPNDILVWATGTIDAVAGLQNRCWNPQAADSQTGFSDVTFVLGNLGSIACTQPVPTCPPTFKPYMSYSTYKGAIGDSPTAINSFAFCPSNPPVTGSGGYYTQASLKLLTRYYTPVYLDSNVASINWTLYCYPPNMPFPPYDTACNVYPSVPQLRGYVLESGTSAAGPHYTTINTNLHCIPSHRPSIQLSMSYTESCNSCVSPDQFTLQATNCQSNRTSYTIQVRNEVKYNNWMYIQYNWTLFCLPGTTSYIPGC